MHQDTAKARYVQPLEAWGERQAGEGGWRGVAAGALRGGGCHLIVAAVVLWWCVVGVGVVRGWEQKKFGGSRKVNAKVGHKRVSDAQSRISSPRE